MLIVAKTSGLIHKKGLLWSEAQVSQLGLPQIATTSTYKVEQQKINIRV